MTRSRERVSICGAGLAGLAAALTVAVNTVYRPFAAASPFLHLGVESSLEKKIDARYNGGLWSKFKLARTERTTADLSLALLAENVVTTESVGRRGRAFARWQAGGRGRHALGDGRVTLTTDVTYRPELDSFGNFTFASTTSVSVSVQLSSVVSLKVSFVDNYDSEATGRGARSNNHGQLFLGC
ncbi:MAG: DUF481 domain-containing protein [Gemmatimonadetes bacterium]|nr:DUF481 domain-containing protein [Gemmatimonadota bacterium]